MRTRIGLSLIEVLVALVVFAAGILPAVYGVAAALAAARRGRARAEVAATLLSRAALIRPLLIRSDSTGCAGGEALVSAVVPLPGGPVADTVWVRVAC